MDNTVQVEIYWYCTTGPGMTHIMYSIYKHTQHEFIPRHAAEVNQSMSFNLHVFDLFLIANVARLVSVLPNHDHVKVVR